MNRTFQYETDRIRTVNTKILQHKATREIRTISRGPSYSPQVGTAEEDGFRWLSSQTTTERHL